jgi:DNA (cytosine-5)-methyltransferase 1
LNIGHQVILKVIFYIITCLVGWWNLLGMFSGTPWDGAYTCNGLVVVRKDGDLLLYHVIKDADLKEYLFLNTKLDAASSTRHRFGTIYQETNGKYYFKLNLQIRNT